MASPSLSGSVARMSELMLLERLSVMSFRVFLALGEISQVIENPLLGSTDPSLAGRSLTCP